MRERVSIPESEREERRKRRRWRKAGGGFEKNDDLSVGEMQARMGKLSKTSSVRSPVWAQTGSELPHRKQGMQPLGRGSPEREENTLKRREGNGSRRGREREQAKRRVVDDRLLLNSVSRETTHSLHASRLFSDWVRRELQEE